MTMVTKQAFQEAILKAQDYFSQTNPQPRVFTLSVKKRFDGYTLLNLYTDSFPHVDKEYWKLKIISGNLTLDGNEVSPYHKVKAGQITRHSVPPKKEPIVSFQIELIEATENYWIINKPSPLPVHAGGRYENNTLTKILKTAFPKQSIHLINRLDANTTGLLIVALNKETAQELGKQFKTRTIAKTYLALVENTPISNYFESHSSIGTTKTAAGGRKLEEGKESNTEFEILKAFENSTLLKVTPHSGRTNQIRLHLAGLGLPIVGDLGYKTPQYFNENPLTYPADTLFLHSWKVSFQDKGLLVTYQVSPNQKWINFL